MPNQSWQGTLITMQADGPAVTLVAESTLLTSQAKYTLPANFLDVPGKTLRVKATGRISNVVSPAGVLTFRVKFGAIVVALSPSFALNAVAKTNVTWILDWSLTLRSVGGTTAATLMHTGQWQSESVIGSPLPSAGSAGQLLIPASAPAVGAGFDSTVSNVVDLSAQFGTTGNSIQAHQYTLESIN